MKTNPDNPELRTLRAFLGFATMGTVPSVERAQSAQNIFDGLSDTEKSAGSKIKDVVADVLRGVLPSYEICMEARDQLKAIMLGNEQVVRDMDAPAA